MFRRSNLSKLLDTDRLRIKGYPLPEFGGLYTPNAVFFRTSEESGTRNFQEVSRLTSITGYAFMDDPILLPVISVAAYARPSTITHKKGPVITYELTSKAADKTKVKIRTIVCLKFIIFLCVTLSVIYHLILSIIL